MSAHFIPFTEHDKDNADAWFGGISGYWAGIRAWKALALQVVDDDDLYQALKDPNGFVMPETIKEFADLIRDLDTNTMALHWLDYLPGCPKEKQYELVLSCAARLKEVILDCAEKGRGILHFH